MADIASIPLLLMLMLPVDLSHLSHGKSHGQSVRLAGWLAGLQMRGFPERDRYLSGTPVFGRGDDGLRRRKASVKA